MTINFCLIGCGRIASRHIEAIQACPDAKLIAVCDTDINLAKDKALLGNVPAYTSYQEMFKQHPDIHIVTLLTPSGLHYSQAIDIIENYQKHLLIEKPFVLTIQQALELKKKAELHGTKVFPLYQNRFNKAVQRVKSAMENKQELGQLRVGTVRVRWCRPQRYYDLSAWRGT